MNYILAPSILSADFGILGEQMKKTEKAGAQYIHFDVMDGFFVPSISFGIPVLESVRKTTRQILDVHLMIQEPVRYVSTFAESGADIITVHLEACEDIDRTLSSIRDCKVKAGISIKPGTPVEKLIPYLDKADMFLIMSVEPGFGGQKFIPESLEKIHRLRTLLNEKNIQADIEVDGGIYQHNVEKVLDSGANVIVSGSGVFKGDIEENTERFMEILKRYE